MKFNTATWTGLDLHKNFSTIISLSPNEHILASTPLFDKRAELWNLETSQPIGTPLHHEDDGIPPSSQQPPPAAAASIPSIVVGTAPTTGTISSPRITIAGWRARFNPSKPAAAPAANPNPNPTSVRPAALEVVVVCALVVLDVDPLDEGDVTVGEIVPVEVVMPLTVPVGLAAVMDEIALCRDTDWEEKREESEEPPALYVGCT
ncbi:hypothetical protein F4604DRAFT_1934882 [Suillus subluteus]|nr:hypothetical protein F4604DRAFT_1934882 [Suillus subluteus]